jgi:hypothetical protein
MKHAHATGTGTTSRGSCARGARQPHLSSAMLISHAGRVAASQQSSYRSLPLKFSVISASRVSCCSGPVSCTGDHAIQAGHHRGELCCSDAMSLPWSWLTAPSSPKWQHTQALAAQMPPPS